MSDKNTSTLQSTIDSVSSTISSGIASLTGNAADQREADKKQASADARHDLSHATAKAGPFTVTPDGAAKDNSDRTQGSWNQTIGSGKETLGNLIGSEDLKQTGARQNAEGKGQEAQGQISDLGQGIGDRVSGAVGGAVHGITGDRAAQHQAELRHDEGKARQRGVEADLDKQSNRY